MTSTFHQASSARNAAVLERELAWLSEVIDARIRHYLGNERGSRDLREIEPPRLQDEESTYTRILRENVICFEERILLLLALVPHLKPQMLDPFLLKNPNLDRGFTEFGGVKSGEVSGFLPTVETAAFVLGGSDLASRFRLQEFLNPERFLRRSGMIHIDENAATPFSSPLSIGKQYLGLLTHGAAHQPAFSSAFPAKRLNTQQEWSDLVLIDTTMADVEEILAWIKFRDELLQEWNLSTKIKPGFRSLFYGPPGTGKTLTASLLGKATGLDVYRVDLSLIVSKWVGETEKNLGAVFDEAEKNNWILFFDEADALFGKRSQTSSAHDRYANQEVAYLLQRVEDLPGVVILATNFKANIDEAFARRFQSMIYFPIPAPAERLRLWKGAFGGSDRLDRAVNLEQLAVEFEMTGGAIVNVLRYASLKALQNGTSQVSMQDIRHGIRREFRKHGKTI